MKRLAGLIALILGALLPAAAGAQVSAPDELTPLIEQMRVPVPDVLVVEAPCPDPGGYAAEFIDGCLVQRTIFVDFASLDAALADYPEQQVLARRALLYHELGHAYARQRMSRKALELFAGIASHHRRAWRLGGVLDERFADAYANCAAGTTPRQDEWMDGYGYAPTGQQRRRVCRMIRRASADDGG